MNTYQKACTNAEEELKEQKKTLRAYNEVTKPYHLFHIGKVI